MANCYIYSHYGFGLGHLQRSKLIALELKRKGFDVTLFSSGARLPKKFIPSGLKFVQLESEEPTLVYAKNLPSNKNITKNEMIRKRIKEVKKEFNKKIPNIFITEFFPFSPFRLEKTLIPILEEIRRKYPECIVVSSIRDIPLTRLEKKKIDLKTIRYYLKKYYNLILVHADKDMSSFAKGRKLSKFKVDLPIFFTGYVSNSSNSILRKKYQIIVSVGGGRDGEKIIGKSIDALNLLAKKGKKIKTLVVLGPLGRKIDTKSNKNIKVIRFIPDLFKYIKNAELSLNMMGYNTNTEIFHSGIPAIYFPRKGSYEQNERADIISHKRKNIILLNEEDTSSKLLARKILIGLKMKKYPPLKICGAEKSASIIKEFYTKSRKAK